MGVCGHRVHLRRVAKQPSLTMWVCDLSAPEVDTDTAQRGNPPHCTAVNYQIFKIGKEGTQRLSIDRCICMRHSASVEKCRRRPVRIGCTGHEINNRNDWHQLYIIEKLDSKRFKCTMDPWQHVVVGASGAIY